MNKCCPCGCAGASRIVGVLGVVFVAVAILVKLFDPKGCLHLLNLDIPSNHLLIGANTLMLIAMLFRPSATGSCECDKETCGCDKESSEKK